LKDGLGVDTELIAGGGGVFDVTVDGKLVYSKFRTGRYPEYREIAAAISGRK